MCHVKLVVDEADRDSIDLVLGEAKLDMGKELTEYFMTDDPSLVFDEEGGVDFKIIFKRRLSNEVGNTWPYQFMTKAFLQFGDIFVSNSFKVCIFHFDPKSKSLY